MSRFAVKEKAMLGELLAGGYARFGSVAPRRPYKEDDTGGGTGAAELLPEHPLLASQPVGAASDLTAIASQNSNSLEAAKEKENELCPQLKKQLSNVLALGKQHVAKPTPYG